MFRTPLIISATCILISLAISLYVWMNLPVMDHYPIHWNAKGEADGFGSKAAVAVTLLIFPLTTLFMTALFWALPKIEPLRNNLLASHKAYNATWIATMLFMVGLSILIALSYLTDNGAALAASPQIMVISMAILFIVIGNYLGKVRQNFMFGIRTPWTLTSEASWEKTHRLGAWGFVLTGLISIVAALVAPHIAIWIFTAVMMVMVLFLCVYSYVIWKNDPHKRQS